MVERNNWSKVSLRISSGSIEPEQITQMTGLHPSEQYRMGDHIGHNPRYATVKTHTWLLDSGLPDNVTVEEKLQHLIALIEPSWQRLGQPAASIGFFCTLTPDPHQDGFSFDSSLLQKLSRLSADLNITILPATEGTEG